LGRCVVIVEEFGGENVVANGFDHEELLKNGVHVAGGAGVLEAHKAIVGPLSNRGKVVPFVGGDGAVIGELTQLGSGWCGVVGERLVEVCLAHAGGGSELGGEVLAEEGRIEELIEEVAGGGKVWQASGAERDEEVEGGDGGHGRVADGLERFGG